MRFFLRLHTKIISIDGQCLNRYPPVYIITQKPGDSLFPTMSVYENMMISMSQDIDLIRYIYHTWQKEKCITLLKKAQMKLEDKIDEQVRFLSGWQQQALSIILALIGKYSLILLDEPTAALDESIKNNILKLLLDGIRENKSSAIIVSHDLALLSKYCDEALLLEHNTISKTFIKGKNLNETTLKMSFNY
jgi:ABC-type glutathione transport system ATPase component